MIDGGSPPFPTYRIFGKLAQKSPSSMDIGRSHRLNFKTACKQSLQHCFLLNNKRKKRNNGRVLLTENSACACPRYRMRCYLWNIQIQTIDIRLRARSEEHTSELQSRQ